MAGTNSPKTVNAAATTPRKFKSRIASQVQDGGTGQGAGGLDGLCRTSSDLRGVSESKPCSVFCCLVCIDRAVFASIEDSDSDLDNHGEDSSSNTSADDHMTTKRSQCRLQGAGVKEVRGTHVQQKKMGWRNNGHIYFDNFHDCATVSVLFVNCLFF